MSSITVGALTASDDVTVQIAIDEGFFKQQGLNVKVVTMGSTNDATSGLLSHTLDFTTENYVGMFNAEHLVPNLNLRIVADNAQSSPGLYVMMVQKNSTITSLAQLKGKKVAFPALGFNFGSMAADIQLAPYHLSSASFTTVPLPFSDAQQALARGEVDAAFTTEPFVTIAKTVAGDRVLADMMGGPLASFPVSCWATTASFAASDPRTVAAFQRAMVRAVQLAAANPALVRRELVKFIPTMKPAIAQVIILPTFHPVLTLARMQLVASEMERLGALPKGFDVTSMFYPPAASA
jgi:NitT/TauT family transport system substrate-binding protein